MSEPENTLPDSGLSELKQECSDLRRQSNLVFLAITVISLTFTAWLAVQSHRAGKDLEVVMQQQAQFHDKVQKEKTVLDNLAARLAAYGQNHSDFAAILYKYQIVKQNTNAVSPSSALPDHPLPGMPR